jgi:hypothetical protein
LIPLRLSINWTASFYFDKSLRGKVKQAKSASARKINAVKSEKFVELENL